MKLKDELSLPKETLKDMLSQSFFESELYSTLPQPQQFKFLLAASGGSDSMVLATLLLNLGIYFEIAHVNYKLRGESSDLDQKILENFGKKHQIPVHVYEVSGKDQKPENSIQLWARELRYSFFEKLKKDHHLDFLLTAHHLNDQLETFIINLSKASGINGLSGIPKNENKIIRPLLKFTKQEIYEFAQENNIEFREDESNKKNDYLRNKIRNNISPLLLETNENFMKNFSKSIDILNESKDFIKSQIEKIHKELCISKTNEKTTLNKQKLSKESQFVQFEILKNFGFINKTEMEKIFVAENNSSFFTKSHQIIIHRNEIIFIPKEQEEISDERILLISKEDSRQINSFSIEDKITTIDEINIPFSWDFDAEKIDFPVYLRKKQEGDIFYPTGFSGSKKVSKFFKDEKLSILAKQKIWLLTDRQNNVLGIIPFRQDRRFATSNNTTNILTIYNEKNNEV